MWAGSSSHALSVVTIDFTSAPVPRSKEKPVPVEHLDEVRTAIREWANAEKRNGQKNVGLPDIVEMLTATGMRIEELLALRWSDIELTPPSERRDDEDWFHVWW